MELETKKMYFKEFGIAMPQSEVWVSYNPKTKEQEETTTLQLILHYLKVKERIHNRKHNIVTIGDLNPQFKKFLEW